MLYKYDARNYFSFFGNKFSISGKSVSSFGKCLCFGRNSGASSENKD
jgi:hypothetical protein